MAVGKIFLGAMVSFVCLLVSFSSSGFAGERGTIDEEKILKKQAALDLRRVWEFDRDKVGRVPGGFTTTTVGEGSPSAWSVVVDSQAPSGRHILAQTASCRGSGCFQILLADGLTYDYVELAFRMRSHSGDPIGQGGGVFGFRDPKNFYSVVVNLEKGTLSVIRILNGRETLLGSAPIKRRNPTWHHIRVQRNTIISKEYVETFFDNRLAVSVQDNALGPGQIGLVTSGEIPMQFDNFDVIRLYSQHPLSSPPAY